MTDENREMMDRLEKRHKEEAPLYERLASESGRSTQMFFDRGEESFLGEVIQILKVESIHIDIRQNQSTTSPNRVRVEFVGELPDPSDPDNDLSLILNFTAFGRSYGECLRQIREKIREATGK